MNGDAFARIIPFACYIGFLAANDRLSIYFAGAGLDVRWLYALKVGVVAILLIWFWRRFAELNRIFAVNLRHVLVSFGFGLLVFLIWIIPYPEWATLGGKAQGFDPTGLGGGVDPRLAGIRIAGAALVVPVMEELFWRSYLMRWIENQDFQSVDPARIGRVAFIVSAVLFGLEHNLWLAGVLAGCAYGWLYIEFRNLWLPVIAHATTNAILGIWVLSTQSWQYW